VTHEGRPSTGGEDARRRLMEGVADRLGADVHHVDDADDGDWFVIDGARINAALRHAHVAGIEAADEPDGTVTITLPTDRDDAVNRLVGSPIVAPRACAAGTGRHVRRRQTPEPRCSGLLLPDSAPRVPCASQTPPIRPIRAHLARRFRTPRGPLHPVTTGETGPRGSSRDA